MRIVTRAQWGARAPKNAPTYIDTPTSKLFLHHTAGSEPDGQQGVRAIQRFHQFERGWNDIAYSFVVDRTGTVFEGRGPGVAGAHTKGHNSTSHAICVIGNYQTQQVPQPVIEAVADLVAHGARSRWWVEPKITGGHRDVGSTACPGDNLYRLIDHINLLAQPSLEKVVEPIYYARRGTPDYALACWAAQSANPGRGSASCDREAVRTAARGGADVVAVGGPADSDLTGVPHRLAVGADGVETGEALIRLLQA